MDKAPERPPRRIERARALVPDAWHGVLRVPVLTGAFVAILGALMLVKIADDVRERDGVTRSDPGILRDFVQHRATGLVDTAKALSDIGSVGMLAVIAAVAALFLWWRRVPLIVALSPVGALGVAGLFVAAGKSIFSRPRPPLDLHLVTESAASFPSGHATDSAATFGTIAVLVAVFLVRRWVVRLAVLGGAVGLTAAIALSRLELGVHWPSDVLAGMALGTSVALVAVGTGLALTYLGTRCAPSSNAAYVRVLRALNFTRR